MKNNWFYITFIVALAAIAVFLWDRPPSLLLPRDGPIDESKLIPYAVIDAAISRHFDEEGHISYEFSAKTLKHFRTDLASVNEEDFTTLEAPLLTLYANGELWYIQAKTGRVIDQGETLKLAEDVRVWQEKPTGDILELTTSELLIYPNKKRVETEKEVTIRSPQGAIQAMGMVVNLNDKHIQLKSRVRGEHEPI